MERKSNRPRLIVADDNVGNTGGHYFELASQLLGGASQLGYEGVLATGARFTERLNPAPPFELLPTFNARRLVHWSLGVDGHSQYQRGIDGRSVGGSPLHNAWINLIDGIRPKRRPRVMLERWADGMVSLLQQLNPSPPDTLLINTGDDFAMLALAAAMSKCKVPPLRIDVIFHFALYDKGQPGSQPRQLEHLGRQVRAAIDSLAPHQVHLHATTVNLAQQMREANLTVTDIPYPTRSRPIRIKSNANPGDPGSQCRIVLAGLPRAEKGKAAIRDMLAGIEQPLLRTRLARLSMQMPSRRWRSLIPPSLRADYERALEGSSNTFEIMTNNLTPQQYHEWLDTADVGLFLYDPDRYIARCSGVLLEMLVRGVPVVVPEGCWLADQVRLAGGDGSIGYIYQDRSEIPDKLSRFLQAREEVSRRAIEYSDTIVTRHSGYNTLLTMGLRHQEDGALKAAS